MKYFNLAIYIYICMYIYIHIVLYLFFHGELWSGTFLIYFASITKWGPDIMMVGRQSFPSSMVPFQGACYFFLGRGVLPNSVSGIRGHWKDIRRPTKQLGWNHQLEMVKKSWLIILPSYIGIMISHYKDQPRVCFTLLKWWKNHSRLCTHGIYCVL